MTLRGFIAPVFLAALLACCADRLAAQEGFFHPELEWKTIESEHFYVHCHAGAERTGRTVSKIAEEIYAPVTSLYNHTPDQKVSFIIWDVDDISNGAAYFYDNKIEIYAPSMDFELRGTHNWLRNVVTHEFTHIVQIQTSMKFGRKLPSIYLQWLGYESERRQDVLYGYPNKIVSYPISGFVIPAWFAEGVAQYNRKDLRYDFWDTHRDMILRSYALDGNMLTWEQMGVFGKTSLGNESSYNAGFAFVHYLAQRFGEDKLQEISRNLGKLDAMTIDGAIERAVGINGDEVYQEWRVLLQNEYNERVAPIRAGLQTGEPLDVDTEREGFDVGEHRENESFAHPSDFPAPAGNADPCGIFSASGGFANLYPAFSPDGKKLAYVSTKGADYFSQSSLYVYDFEKKKETRLQYGVRTVMSWSPDGKKLYYGRSSRDNPHWSYQFDIYEYDVDEEEEERLTHGKRAISPAVSPDGSTIVFVVNHDGTANLATTMADGSHFKVITPYANGEQVYNPKWSPDGGSIVFDYSTKDGRDIAVIHPDGTDLHFLITGPDDSRTPVFTRDGTRLLFSSDRTGIFNLYAYEFSTGTVAQVSNVLGGAFMPTVNPDGGIVYASYTSGGYKLYMMKNPGVLAEGNHHYIQTTQSVNIVRSGPLAMASNGISTSQFDWPALRSYDDTTIPALESKPYKSIFTSLTLVPFLRLDNYTKSGGALDAIKPGVYLLSNEILDRIGFFAGAALNRKLERDLFFQFNYRGKLPGLYQLGLEPVTSVELYNVTRDGGVARITLPADTINVDVSYNLLEFDFVLSQPFVSQFSNVEFRFAHSRYTSIIGSFVLPSRALVSASSDLYLIANDLSLMFKNDAVVRSTTDEINPVGRKVSLRIGRELNKFNGDGEYAVGATGLVPVYKNINFTRVELQWKEHLPFFFKNHTLTASVRGGSILGPAVDEFFDFYAGGLVGMKGYPFYALGGNELAVFGLTYRFPLSSNLDIRFLPIYFDKLYASFYADIGNAWTGSVPKPKQFKTDAGVELRLESFSFYSYPTRVFVNAAYGFDRFTRLVRSRNEQVTYGKEWSLYFGILFGFDFD